MGKGAGKVIGKYRLGDTIGRGTFGEVKLGQHVETNVRVAVKIITKESLSKSPHGKAHLHREIAIMKSLTHENVTQLLEVLQTPNNIYIVLELVEGGELFEQILGSKKLEEEEARKYFQGLISGLFYVHNQGVAHR
eukprot:gene20877-1137_t